MSENYVEKKFLYLILFSILLHAAIFALLLKLPAEKKQALTEPFMVDLQDIPSFESLPPAVTPPVKRQAEERLRTPRETAPRGDSPIERVAPQDRVLPAAPAPPAGPRDSAAPQRSQPSPGTQLFRDKRRAPAADIAKLYPGAEKMALLEESYRKKYGDEVKEGATRFLNTEDILFGSFLRRFETAVYGVWHYPPEAARMGIEGITPVRITFNRRGEIIGRELLQSSGSKLLDTEVLRTIDQLGPVGAFPRNYDKDTFNLIAFFHYNISGGAQRSLR